MAPEKFYAAWLAVAREREGELLEKWERAALYTAAMLYGDDSVVQHLARKLGYGVHRDYYAIDAVFYRQVSDRVHCAPPEQTWLKNIQIAFEHENHFRSGLFQEVSHLLITRTHLRVLVTYPEGEEFEATEELRNLAQIIQTSEIASDPAMLCIFGRRLPSSAGGWCGINWTAYWFSKGTWAQLTT